MMVESTTDRPHRSKSGSSGATSELFICFSTSRLSSSSMKLSSKSLLSPGRTRDQQQTPQISLSTSLSRRLRTSGSIKGGASPMFPSGGGKKRSGFENPEPSSPKVTCIGQVRVKTKKQGKKMRMISSRSKRRSGSGSGVVGGAEVSFRKAEQGVNNPHESFQALHFPTHPMSSSSQRECLRQRNNNNQRWVHLPLTICEALRAFGSEFNCLIPNKSSCLSGGEAKKDEESKGGGRSESGNSSCGAVFARWFVALGDGEDGNSKRREIELVVGGEEEEEARTEMSSESHSVRRQVFEGIEFKEEILSEALMREEEEGRVSICVPPKNALLLMRCRSDPVKMAALGNRFWEMPAAVPVLESEDEDEDDGMYEKEKMDEDKAKGGVGLDTQIKLFGEDGMCEKWVCEEEEVQEPEEKEEEELDLTVDQEKTEERHGVYQQQEVVKEEMEGGEEEPNVMENMNEAESKAGLDCFLAQLSADPEMSEDEEIGVQVGEAQQEEEMSEEIELPITEVLYKQEEEEDEDEDEAESWAETEPEATEESTESTTEEEKESRVSTWEEAMPVTQHRPEPESERPKTQTDLQRKRSSQCQVLPDCLLLMMCEPKLSMEVSKETWVCSTDFIRCLPERHVSRNKQDGKDEAKKKPPWVSFDSKASYKPAAVAPQQPVILPPRSSCSFPIQPGGGKVSMAEIIGQKLVGSTAYEPFVLTRCKSEPMRSASKLAPEACFWKNRKMEPHRHPGPLGVGATGVGF